MRANNLIETIWQAIQTRIESEKKYFGKYRGIVVDNYDPEDLGRIQVKVPTLFAEGVTDWAMPCSAAHQFFFPPPIDSHVWVEFEQGEINYPVWVGAFWVQSSDTSTAPPKGLEDVPDSNVLRSPAGVHMIELNDKTTGSVSDRDHITITHGTKNSKITINKEGDIKLEEGTDGHYLELDQGGNITVEHGTSGSKILIDPTGNIELNLGGGIIKLGSDSPDQRLVLGDLFQTLWNNHTHLGNLGFPTSSAANSGFPMLDTYLSDIAKTQKS